MERPPSNGERDEDYENYLLEQYRDEIHKRVADIRKHPKGENIRALLDNAYEAASTSDRFGLDKVGLTLDRIQGRLNGEDPQEGIEKLRQSIAERIARLRQRPDPETELLDAFAKSLDPTVEGDKYFFRLIDLQLQYLEEEE